MCEGEDGRGPDPSDQKGRLVRSLGSICPPPAQEVLLLAPEPEPLWSGSWCQMNLFLGAVVDGDFLTDTAEELLQRKEVMKVPVMMGITNHEFGWILPQVGGAAVLSASGWTRPLRPGLGLLLFR